MPRKMYPITVVAMHMGISRERAVRLVQTRELNGEQRDGRWFAALPEESTAASEGEGADRQSRLITARHGQLA